MSLELSRRTLLRGGAATGLGLALASTFGTAVPAYAATQRVACWGDSLTQGAGGMGVSYPGVLAKLINPSLPPEQVVYNGGRGGERSGGIAARQGGVPARTKAGVKKFIPASTTEYVDFDLQGEVFFTGPNIPVKGTLKGVPGTLSRVGETGITHRFFRTTAGLVTEVPGNSVFYPTDGQGSRTTDTIIWAGHADDYVHGRPLPHPQSMEANIAAMVAYTQTSAAPPNYLVLGLINGEGAGNGVDPPPYPPTTFWKRAIGEVNGNLRDAYGPDHFLDVHRYLVDQGLQDAGIPPTGPDVYDIDNDIPPRSLRIGGDSAGHLNNIGYRLVGELVYDFIESKGWLS